jgi:hypothetical protein
MTIPISIKTSGLLSMEKGTLTVTTNGVVKVASFDLQPRYSLILPAASVLLGFLLFLWTLFKRH